MVCIAVKDGGIRAMIPFGEVPKLAEGAPLERE